MNNGLNKFSIFGIALLLPIMTAGADASEISGVTPVTSNGSGIYNIDPVIKSNNAGFRQYEKFELSKGDAANFIMTDISKFVNLVDNKVNINGLVNTVNADMSKNNGGLIFVSPNGVVVGSSGVINAGSLSVYTPDNTGYKSLTDQYEAGNVNFDPSGINIGSGVITVDGKIITNGSVNFNSGKIVIGTDGHVISGVNTENTFMTIDKTTNSVQFSNQEDIFNTLVNTGKTSDSAANIVFTAQNGNIETGGQITAKNGNVSLTAQNGNILNTGNSGNMITSSGDVTITAKGSEAGNVGEVPAVSNDFTKSVNINAGGNVNIYADNVVNVASIDKDLVINEINAGDAVYLQVEDTKGTGSYGLYSAANRTSSAANVTAGKNISITSAGDIGSADTNKGGRFTVSSTSDAQNFNSESWNSDKFNYTPDSSDSGIEVVSNHGSIYLKDNDSSSNIKTLSAQQGSIDAQFNGNTYIGGLTAGKNADILTKGDVLYVDTLENINSFDSDTINTGSTEVRFTALGLGAENPDSVIILKDGAVQSASNGAASTLAFTADNIYADGQRFVMGKEYSQTTDNNTSKITVIDTSNSGGTVNISVNAVTDSDVEKAGDTNGLGRIYYNGNDSINYTVNSSQNPANAIATAEETTTTSSSDNNAEDVDIEDDTDIDPDDGDETIGDTDTNSDEDMDIPSGEDDSGSFGDTDDDTDPDEPVLDDDDDNPDLGDNDSDNDSDPLDSDDDSDTDNPSGGDDSGSFGDTDDDTDPDEPVLDDDDDNPDLGDNDSDDDSDNPLDSDDDSDTDNPAGDDDSGDVGDTDDDTDHDEPVLDDDDDNPDLGDNDSDDDSDNPLDSDDDDDTDIPSGDDDDDPVIDDDTDSDNDDEPEFGDTDNDNDDDIPPINPTNPVAPDIPDIVPDKLNEQFKGHTEPPKPLTLVTDVRLNQKEDYSGDDTFTRLVNTNGLFGDMEANADRILAPAREEAAKKKKFSFRWWMR